MLDLSALISAIHVGAQAADQALRDASYKAFGAYFIDTPTADEAKRLLQQAVDQAAALSEGSSADDIRRITSSLEAASAALNSSAPALQPRTVAIDYPMVTKDGPAVHTVHVPLITLVPFAGIQLSKLVFRADLDVQVENDALKVGFLPAAHGGGADAVSDGSSKANASIEIVVEGAPAADGLKKVIEGYERALRAQIPG